MHCKFMHIIGILQFDTKQEQSILLAGCFEGKTKTIKTSMSLLQAFNLLFLISLQIGCLYYVGHEETSSKVLSNGTCS